MASTSNDSCSQVLRLCLAGQSVPDSLLSRSLREDDGRAFFSIVVERLGDLFEPDLCDIYAQLMGRVLGIGHERYAAVRRLRECSFTPRTVYVLSRVTLGADVAVTSVLLAGLKHRFPDARIVLVGARKNWELFAADPRIFLEELVYPRGGSLAERLRVLPHLSDSDSIVVDPDSRLSQLGLLPICPQDRHFLFESRGYGGHTLRSLPDLAGEWFVRTFGGEKPSAYVAPIPVVEAAQVAVSLGVGENPEKRVADPFERELLRALAARGLHVVVDEGAGLEEPLRVRAAIKGLPRVGTWRGSYAGFASIIQQSKLYIGYDSAGQHVAAACGTPLVSVFAGHVSERMFARWSPTSGVIVKVDAGVEDVLERTLTAVEAGLESAQS